MFLRLYGRYRLLDCAQISLARAEADKASATESLKLLQAYFQAQSIEVHAQKRAALGLGVREDLRSLHEEQRSKAAAERPAFFEAELRDVCSVAQNSIRHANDAIAVAANDVGNARGGDSNTVIATWAPAHTSNPVVLPGTAARTVAQHTGSAMLGGGGGIRSRAPLSNAEPAGVTRESRTPVAVRTHLAHSPPAPADSLATPAQDRADGVCVRAGCSLASAHAGAHFASHWHAEGRGLQSAVTDSPSFFTVSWPSAGADGDAEVAARLLSGALDEVGEADSCWERRLRVRFDPEEACPRGALVGTAGKGTAGYLTRCEVSAAFLRTGARARARAGVRADACEVCARMRAAVPASVRPLPSL